MVVSQTVVKVLVPYYFSFFFFVVSFEEDDELDALSFFFTLFESLILAKFIHGGYEIDTECAKKIKE